MTPVRCFTPAAVGYCDFGLCHREEGVLPKTFCRPLLAALSLVLQLSCSIGKAHAEETKPVFELDCVSFAGRFLDSAPVKKKAHPGLAVDGTTWSVTPEKHVVISRIVPGESAQKAGLEPGDEIISVNGYATSGLPLRELFYAYHMYRPDTLMETLVVQKKDGTQKTHKLALLPIDKCEAEEKRSWLELYKYWGY